MMLPGPITTQAVMSPGPTRLYHAVGELFAERFSVRAVAAVSFEDSSVMMLPEAGILSRGHAQCVENRLRVQTLTANRHLRVSMWGQIRC